MDPRYERWDPYGSPIRPLLETLVGAIENIAPEKAEELESRLARVALVVDDSPGFLFRVSGNSDPRTVKASLVGLEYLWTMSYGGTATYQHSKRVNGDFLNFSDHPETAAAAELMQFGLNDRLGPGIPQFAMPAWLPHPEFFRPGSAEDATLVQLATELYAGATAWILHHELGHVHLNHLDEELTSPSDELAADREATEWLLAGIEHPVMVTKRALGAALAVTTVAALELRAGPKAVDRRRYPPAGERVLAALSHPALGENHQSQDFAALVLKVHLDSVGVEIGEVEAPTAYDLLRTYCIAMMRHWA